MNFTFKTAFFHHQKYILAVIIIPLFFWGCGYRLAGSGNLPGGVQSVAIEVFENRTPEIGLENIITNDLIYEFTRRGRSVQKSSKTADATLTGVIESERITTISRQAQQSPLARRVEITVRLMLTDRDGVVKWSTSGVSIFEEYDVSSNRTVTERNKRIAIETLSKKIAERIHNRLTDNF
jgi:hypothetical protein